MAHARLSDVMAGTGQSGPGQSGIGRPGAGRPIFAGARSRTPWQVFDVVHLEGGEVFEPEAVATGSEEGFLVLQGCIELGTARQRVEEVAVARRGGQAGPASRCQACTGGDSPARFIYVRVAAGEDGGPAQSTTVEAVARDRLTWRSAIHGGVGRIATRHIWEPDDFASAWTFLDHAVLATDSSVGYHYHDGLEECFVVLSGSGFMTVNGRTFEVGPGSVTFQGIGEGHGIYNPNDEELDFLRIAVGVPGEVFTSIDLDDDLSGWQPS